MDNSYGILSLAPALIAVILAFITREALFSILCGVLVGLLITGQDLLFGFTGLIQSALGNADYHLGHRYRGVHRYHGGLLPEVRRH